MYIISKYKDYYDGIAGTVGIDRAIMYVRETMEIEDHREFPKEFAHYNDSLFGWHKTPFAFVLGSHLRRGVIMKYEECKTIIVGFCGKLYVGWKLHYTEDELIQSENRIYPSKKTRIVYNIEEAKEFVNFDLHSRNLQDDVDYILNYNAIEIFRTFNTPVFVMDMEGIKFVVNPLLKEYQFYSVVNPFTAFQEISMFIGGVLGSGEKDIVEVSDKSKITQHGFDYKYSFRKEPEKKK